MDAKVEPNSEIAEDALAGGGALSDALPAQVSEVASAAPWASFREQAFSTRTPMSKPQSQRKADSFVLGAGLSAAGLVAIALVAIGGLAAYEFLYQSVELSTKIRQVDEIASRMTALEDRVDSIQAAQRHEPGAAGEGANESQTRDVGNAIAELNGRVSRIDDGVAAHFADIALRLDKLEEKAPTTVALAQPPAAPKPSPTPASTNPPSITEITAPIENPTRVLRGFTFTRLQGGVASIKGPDGAISVSAGDAIPGAGQVLRIVKRGNGWVVVTSLGIIKMAAKASAKARRPSHPPAPAPAPPAAEPG